MDKVTQFSIALENVPGQLGRLCRVLTQAISISDAADLSTIRLLVSNTTAAKRALREAGITFVTQEVLLIEVEDKPGALEDVALRLGEAGINVQYVYGMGDGGKGFARMVLRVSDVDRAKQVLA